MNIEVIHNGVSIFHEVPEGINLNLMEFLKALEYPLEAVCGGMCLCSTCHVFVKTDNLGEPSEDEEITLSDIPLSKRLDISRLSCQIPISLIKPNTIIEIP